MKQNNNHIDIAIDKFYGENPGPSDKSVETSKDYIEYIKKLDSTSGKLNLPGECLPDFDVNTLSIIEKAEDMKAEAKSKRELLLFILTSMVLVSLYIAAGSVWGLQAILISQVIILTLIPWIVLPIALVRNRRNKANG